MSDFNEMIRLTLDGVNLPDIVYEEYDVSGLDDVFYSIDEDGTTFDLVGTDYGPDNVIYDIACSNAMQLWANVKEVVENYPLCSGAKVEFINANNVVYEAFSLPVA